MDDQLIYSKHEQARCNGKSRKLLKSEQGNLEIQALRERNGSFESKSVGIRQSRVSGIDDKILSLFAKGQSTRDIAATIEELYNILQQPYCQLESLELINK